MSRPDITFFREDHPKDSHLRFRELTVYSPLFAQFTRPVRWLRDGEYALRRFQARAFGICLILTLIAALLIVQINGDAATGRRDNLADSLALSSLSLLVALATVPALSVLDFWMMNAATRELRASGTQWELLRLTPMSKRGIIVSICAAVRMRGWRYSRVIMAVRAGAVLLGLMAAGAQFVTNTAFYLRDASNFLLSGIIPLTIFVSVGVTFILEPRWRLQMMSALALALAAHLKNIPLRIFVNVLLVIMVWCILPIYLIFIGYISAGCLLLITFPVTVPIGLFFGWRGFYHFFEYIALRQAEDFAFREQMSL